MTRILDAEGNFRVSDTSPPLPHGISGVDWSVRHRKTIQSMGFFLLSGRKMMTRVLVALGAPTRVPARHRRRRGPHPTRSWRCPRTPASRTTCSSARTGCSRWARPRCSRLGRRHGDWAGRMILVDQSVMTEILKSLNLLNTTIPMASSPSLGLTGILPVLGALTVAAIV